MKHIEKTYLALMTKYAVDKHAGMLEALQPGGFPDERRWDPSSSKSIEDTQGEMDAYPEERDERNSKRMKDKLIAGGIGGAGGGALLNLLLSGILGDGPSLKGLIGSALGGGGLGALATGGHELLSQYDGKELQDFVAGNQQDSFDGQNKKYERYRNWKESR